MAPALLVCGAKVKVRSFEGERELSIENFFIGPGQTAIKHSELLTEIQVPNLPTRSGSVYLKQTRTNGADLAVVGVAAMVEMDGEVVKDAKIALGAVAPTPFRVKNAERSLRGKSLDESILEEVAQMASLEAKPIDDVRSSADYRRKLIYVLAKRAIKGAINKTG